MGLEVRHAWEGLAAVGHGAWVLGATSGVGFFDALGRGFGGARAAAALVASVGFVLLVDIRIEWVDCYFVKTIGGVVRRVFKCTFVQSQ